MALINCKHCDNQISDKAKACPKCGNPVIVLETFKCFECEEELQKGAKICSNCGAEQESEQIDKTETIPAQEGSSTIFVQQTILKEKRKSLRWILIGIGILILIVVGFILITNSNGNDHDKKVQDSINMFEAAKRLQDSINISDSLSRIQRIMDSTMIADSMAAAFYNSHPNHSSQSNQQKTAFELRQELLAKENENPLDYLRITYNLSVNVRLIKESEDVITGTIYNSASIATYKEIVLLVKFMTNTDVVITKKRYTVSEYVQPNNSTSFKIKVVSPSGTRKIGVEILDASAY